MLDTWLTSPVLVATITIAASAVTGIITWFFGRRKSEFEIAEISTRVYNTLVTDLEDRVERQSKTIVEQDAKITKQDEKYEKIIIYVEKLEDLLIESNIIKRKDLEAIKVGLGV